VLNEKELLRGNTRSLLLYLIARSGRIHGYGLIQEIRSRSKGYFQFRAGTVYPVLHKLEREGLIRGEWASGGRQQRRHYTITEKGKKALARQLSTWAQFSTAVNLILQPKGA
jgi:PadR family transcriptional regulator PadR